MKRRTGAAATHSNTGWEEPDDKDKVDRAGVLTWELRHGMAFLRTAADRFVANSCRINKSHNSQ